MVTTTDLSEDRSDAMEIRRLAALDRMRILHTPAEDDFDDLVLIASQVFDVPIALVSLVASDHQWFKARIGLEATQTHRDFAFCAHAMRSPDRVFSVEDASLDPRFATNPLVTGEPHIRFYAGAPIVDQDGLALGTVCVIDIKPGVLDATRRRCLEALGRHASLLLELRRKAIDATLVEEALIERNATLAQTIDSTEAALRQSQKMEALGQLTGGLAHDFNNLLTGIAGSLDLMQLRLAAGRTGELARYLTAAQGAARRAAALTHRLLAFARRQTLDPKPTDVHRLIADMSDLIRRTAGPQIDFEVIGDPMGWAAMVDANQLENAVLNLCINARDAMPDGGRLSIEIATVTHHADVAYGLDLSPGEYLSLSVRDTGTGMSDDVIARAFDPFFTTKPIGSGTGLGLSMVHGFARQSGGRAHIRSEAGRGTTVCLELPRHVGTVGDDEADAPRPLVIDAGHDETVLVIDDEPAVRMLVSEILVDLGYRLLEAEDGASGLRLLQSAARIDLLITDVGLPGGLNGRQVADAARSLRPDLKVLFITGYAEHAVLGDGRLDAGMQMLTKPFSLGALAQRIAEMLSNAAGPTSRVETRSHRDRVVTATPASGDARRRIET